ncbi:MAG TPA: acyl-CoA dehydrogenase family protein [Acidimicrobiia bacterium]
METSISVDEFEQEAREWLTAHFEPIGARRTRPRGVDHRTVEQMADERAKQRVLFDGGFAAITWPVEYGGRGLSHEHEVAFLQQAAQHRMPDLGVVGGTTYGVCANTMLRHASPEFLRRHGPAMFAGDELWCQLFSEPSAGSDLAGITTRATRDGDRWLLTGSKVWSSGAVYADYGMCLARTNWDVPKHRGLTWFAVKLDAKGVEIQPIREINGDTEFCQEFLDDVDLSDDDVIGEVDQGWSVAQTMLVFERGAGTPGSAVMAAPPQGLAPDLVALARRVGRERDPVVRQLIAKAHTNAYVHGQLARRIAQHLRIDPSAAAGIASYGKLAAGTFLPIRARIGMEIGGPAALVWDDEEVEEQRASLDHLNSRIMSIAGGTNEMQRNAIGERVLGLPREPSFDTKKPFREVLRDAADWK